MRSPASDGILEEKFDDLKKSSESESHPGRSDAFHDVVGCLVSRTGNIAESGLPFFKKKQNKKTPLKC